MGIEQEYFSFEAWDDVDVMCIQFYDCVLKKDIGKSKAGEKIGSICIDYNHSIIELYSDDGKTSIGRYKLSLTIGEETTYLPTIEEEMPEVSE